jgi:hypothetical protein
MKKLLSSISVLSACMPALAAPPTQTYVPTVTAAERTAIHARFDALA